MLFISYSSKDEDYALKAVAFLEARGVPCWIAKRDIRSGTGFSGQIINGIRQCSGFVLIASERVNQSNHINSEVAQAFDLRKKIYPFLIENIVFSDDYLYYLRQFQRINAYDDLDRGLEDLYRAVTQVGPVIRRDFPEDGAGPRCLHPLFPTAGPTKGSAGAPSC